MENPVIHQRLADMQAQLEALRALAYRAGEAIVNGVDTVRLASMAKYLAGKLALEIPSACAQFFGGQGYMWKAVSLACCAICASWRSAAAPMKSCLMSSPSRLVG